MKTKFERIAGELAELNEDAVLFDGYEDALIGISIRYGQPPIACYDYNKCIIILMDKDGMSREEAMEYFEFNTLGCWAGDSTPSFICTNYYTPLQK